MFWARDSAVLVETNVTKTSAATNAFDRDLNADMTTPSLLDA
jgi:hypothetical protein